MKKLYVKSSEDWRVWLAKHHDSEIEIWLIFDKDKGSDQTLNYEQAVCQALCYGWIDSIIRKIDDFQYAQKFTPRKDHSKWSEVNKARAKKLIKSKLMTKFGLAKVEAAKLNGNWDNPVKPKTDFKIPDEFQAALEKDNKAHDTYKNLAPSYQRQYIGWIAIAKKHETMMRRIKESIQLLRNGQKLGMK
jgi:uncharacterized protein YdeI (YjbR/CyaY-like superfamily)